MDKLEVVSEANLEEEMSRVAALDLIDLLSDEKYFPNPVINQLMKTFSRKLNEDGCNQIRGDLTGGVSVAEYHRESHMDRKPTDHVLVVPVIFSELFELDSQELIKIHLEAFVGAVSAVRDRGKKGDNVESRKREFNETVDKSRIDLVALLSKWDDSNGFKIE